MKNIENIIKKEFQNRAITPNKNAWKILNAQLEVTNAKKENKKRKFLAYAAIFIGLLFSVIIFLNNNASLEQPTIVDANSTNNKIPKTIQEKDKKTKRDFLVKKQHTEQVKIVKNISIKKAKTKIVKKHILNNQIINNTNNIAITKENKSKIDKKPKVKNSNNTFRIVNNSNTIATNQTIDDKKPNQNTNPKENNKVIKKKLFSTDADIDLLLNNALIASHKTKTVEKVNIQSTYLQYSLENEIHTPISNKILNTLNAGVDTVEKYITSNN